MTINRKTPEAMKDRGITTQRRLLLDVLHQARRHLSARQLYQEAIKKNPRISLATVYRSLRLFKELGLVEERHLNKADCYYEIKRSTEHYHLMCRACGRVVEFESSLVDKCRQSCVAPRGLLQQMSGRRRDKLSFFLASCANGNHYHYGLAVKQQEG